jgi:ribosomal protein S18 acetylase RimI-like enzyme
MIASRPVNPLDISIRRAESSDSEFAYEALLTMRPYVESTWGGWLEADGRSRTASDAQAGRSQIVQLNSVPVALLCVDQFETHLQLDQLFIIPEYQRRGIGAHVLGIVLADARNSGLPVRLRVLRVNPAKHFYERYGFKVVSETPERFFMEHSGAGG